MATIKRVWAFLKAHFGMLPRAEAPVANGQDDPNYHQVVPGFKFTFFLTQHKEGQQMDLLSKIPGKLWVWVAERVWGNFKSTKMGLVITGSVMAGMTMLGCNPDLLWAGVMALVAGLPMILGTDSDKIADKISDIFKSAVAVEKPA